MVRGVWEEDKDGCNFLKKLQLPRGKRIQNEQIMLKPFGGSSFGAQDIYTIIKNVPTDYYLITKGN